MTKTTCAFATSTSCLSRTSICQAVDAVMSVNTLQLVRTCALARYSASRCSCRMFAHANHWRSGARAHEVQRGHSDLAARQRRAYRTRQWRTFGRLEAASDLRPPLEAPRARPVEPDESSPAQRRDSSAAAPASRPSAFPRNEIGTPVREAELKRYMQLYRSMPHERSYIIPDAVIQVCMRTQPVHVRAVCEQLAYGWPTDLRS